MAPKPAVQTGDVLLTIHEFIARSPDELSLTKGDKIELIERDDDFGDGWYLGRHLETGLTGLFPEVYTTLAPKPSLANTISAPTTIGRKGPAMTPNQPSSTVDQTSTTPIAPQNSFTQDAPISTAPVIGMQPPAQEPRQMDNPVSPVTPANTEFQSPFDNRILPPAQPVESQRSTTSPGSSGVRSMSQSSAVMNETLSVIDEHITDLRKPNPPFAMRERRFSNDSGSQYEMSSYIAGEETDEEESSGLTMKEVSNWSPARVSQYLAEIGVEQKHCQVFLEQEFSGEVLLEMEQSSIFLKELDLGPIGRRLKTWQKIKSLQDAVKQPVPTPKKRTSRRPMSSTASGDTSRQSTPVVGGSNLPRIPQYMDNSSAEQLDVPGAKYGGPTAAGRPEAEAPPSSWRESPRPSAASVRSIGHVRGKSSTDKSLRVNPDPAPHEKQASLDRNWTMGTVTGPNGVQRPSSAVHTQSWSTDRSQLVGSPGPEQDRGYSSGGELDSKRQRNVLKKRDPSEHSRQSSRTSFRRSPQPTTPTFERRQSGNRILSEPFAGPVPSSPRTDASDPAQLEKLAETKTSPEENQGATRKAPRAVSDAVTGREKALVTLPVEKPSPSETTLSESPTQTGSSTPSGANRSLEYENTNQGSFASGMRSLATMTSRKNKPKTKQETSAYQRGLEKVPPHVQLIGADFSGWMRKRSSNLMTTWKPRFFVLKGRRLSYYYSDDDTEEKGLIDISNHRVLPATNDVFTNMLAGVTGANSPQSPRKRSLTNPNSPATGDERTPTSAATDPLGSPVKYVPSLNPTNSNRSRPQQSSQTSGEALGESTFIFKLVPPRTGLSKAVNFTRPMVHYFAVSSRELGRQWMAALMKATIDRDEAIKVITTYQQKTISLEAARARRERPPALMDLNEEDDQSTLAPSETKSEDKSFVGSQTSQSTNLVTPEEANADLSRLVSDLESMDKGRSPQQPENTASKRWSRRSSGPREKSGARGLGINLNFTSGSKENNSSIGGGST